MWVCDIELTAKEEEANNREQVDKDEGQYRGQQDGFTIPCHRLDDV